MHKKRFMLLFILSFMVAGCDNSLENNDSFSSPNSLNNKLVVIPREETTTNQSNTLTSVTNTKLINKRMTAEEMCEEIVKTIQDEDAEKLKGLFCNEIDTTHNLDEELSSFFNSVDGKFVFFSDYHNELDGAGERKKGVYVKYHIASVIRLARTDSGKEYEIEFYANLVYDEDPNKVGLEYLILTNSNGEEIRVGEYIDR